MGWCARRGILLRDLARLPSLLSLSRIGLAGAFAGVAGHPAAALAVLGLSGLTDVLDGFLARRLGCVTRAGAAADGVADKVFVLVVAATLLLRRALTPADLVLLGMRDLGELLLFAWLSSRGRFRGAETVTALGKATTVLQYAAVGAAVLGSASKPALVDATAVIGALAAAGYAARQSRGTQGVA